jgi:hypothetical protein
MRKSRYYVTIILTFLVTKVAFSQLNKPKKEKFPSYFGVQVRPVFPTQFIGEPITVLTIDYFTTTITQKTGYSFGGTVRAGLTKLLALETGINFTQRNFNISMEIPDSNLYAKNDISFISYDIPINGLVYIQLSEKFYMNTSLGIALTFKPTDVGVLTLPGGTHSFTHTGYSQRKAGIDLNANFGFEYRTEKSGFFYIGGSARVPFNSVFTMVAQYKNQGNEKTVQGEIDGSFLALDFKYFFPNIKNKGPQFQQGPIQ